MFVIFIAGASASGKSSIANALLQLLLEEGRTAQILSMDNYYVERPLNDPDLIAYRLNTNFDIPEMIDCDLLKAHLEQLSRGNSIAQPIFQFQSSSREREQTIAPSEFIIVECIFAQYFLKKYFNNHQPSLSIFVSVDSYLELLKRRQKRDCMERSSSVKMIMQQERRNAGPGFFRFTAPYSTQSDLYIYNDSDSDQNDMAIEANKIKMAIEEKQRKFDLEQSTAMQSTNY